MTKVINLPGAAAAPVLNHRRRGSYGKKVLSIVSERQRRRPKTAAGVQPQENSQQDTEAILRVLYSKAKAEQLAGLLVIYRPVSGEDQVVASGPFRSDPMRSMMRVIFEWNKNGADE